MDFEWQTRAPGDVTSPFYQLSMQHESGKNRRLFGATALLPPYYTILTHCKK